MTDNAQFSTFMPNRRFTRRDFYFDLPTAQIAQYPLPERRASRLLTLDGASGAIADRQFAELPTLLRPGDLLIFNTTRVLPARLLARKATGGRVEILIERLLDGHTALAHLRANKPQRPGTRLYLTDEAGAAELEIGGRDGDLFVLHVIAPTDSDQSPQSHSDKSPQPFFDKSPQPPFAKGGLSSSPPFEKGGKGGFPSATGGQGGISTADQSAQPAFDQSPLPPFAKGGEELATFAKGGLSSSPPFEKGGEGGFSSATGGQGGFPTFADLMQRYGQVPLPPYIHRPPEASDVARYQTVYAKHAGAVAAPTAGLHFDAAMLAQLQTDGVNLGEVTLHVGAGTFQPVRVEQLDQHQMHREWLEVTAAVCAQIAATKAAGGRVIAVGTTAVRSLETAAAVTGQLQPYRGDTQLFIRPGAGDQFRVVDALITNFHVPESTLLMLVAAFAGYDAVMAAYRHAVAAGYRFFSYGDAMFLTAAAAPSTADR